LYHFDHQPRILGRGDVEAIVQGALRGNGTTAQIVELLAWFGFLGVIEDGTDEPRFSYQVRYNMEKLLTPIRRGTARFCIHAAFRRALSTAEV